MVGIRTRTSCMVPLTCGPRCEGFYPPTNRGEPYDPENHESVTATAVKNCASRMVCVSSNEALMTETDSDSVVECLFHIPTGSPITEIVRVREEQTGDIQWTEYWFWDETLGEMNMTNNTQLVGRNCTPDLQLQGTKKFEIFDPANDVIVTAADLKAAMAGTSPIASLLGGAITLRGFKSDGSEASLPFDDSEHFIAKIDFDLKPKHGGAGDLSESDGRATTSEAVYSTDGVEFVNVDPGGSRTGGQLVGDKLIRPDFDQTGVIKVLAGSVVALTVVGATLVIDEDTV